MDQYQHMTDSIKNEDEDLALVVTDVETCIDMPECEDKNNLNEGEGNTSVTVNMREMMTESPSGGLPNSQTIEARIIDQGKGISNQIVEQNSNPLVVNIQLSSQTRDEPKVAVNSSITNLSPIKRKLAKCSDCPRVFFAQIHYTRHMRKCHAKYPLLDVEGNTTGFYKVQTPSLKVRKIENSGKREYSKSWIEMETKRIKKKTLWENSLCKLTLSKAGQKIATS